MRRCFQNHLAHKESFKYMVPTAAVFHFFFLCPLGLGCDPDSHPAHQLSLEKAELPPRLWQGPRSQSSLLSSLGGLGPSPPCDCVGLHPPGPVAVQQTKQVSGLSLGEALSSGPASGVGGTPVVQLGLHS